MVDGVKGVDRAILIRTSMGASRRFVKKRAPRRRGFPLDSENGVCALPPTPARLSDPSRKPRLILFELHPQLLRQAGWSVDKVPAVLELHVDLVDELEIGWRPMGRYVREADSR